MDIASTHVINMLDTLASCNSMLVRLAQTLRSQAEVIQTERSLECWKYQANSALEGYVDVELHSGKAVAWHLEMQWNDKQWFITSRITINDAQGQDTIREFPDRVVNTLEECVEQLLQVTEELVNSANEIDLASL